MCKTCAYALLLMFQVPEIPLPSLLTLDLSYNSISILPPEMSSNLSALRHLDLSHNLLTQVPLVTFSLQQLRALHISHNPITALTNTSLLGGAQKLRELDIRQLPLGYFEVNFDFICCFSLFHI